MGKYDDIISDMFKDAAGFRPSAEWLQSFSASSEAEQDKEVEYLGRLMQAEELAQQAAYDAAVAKFEAAIKELIELGAGTRDTAIKWYLDSLPAHQIDYDAGYVCYCLGLPYSMEAVFKPFIVDWFERHKDDPAD